MCVPSLMPPFSRANALAELSCLTVAKLLVLHRMAEFALGAQWEAWGRRLLCLVVAGNALVLCANVASAVFWVQQVGYDRAAAAALQANNTAAAQASLDATTDLNRSANIASSVQQFAEVGMLSLVLAAFIIVGAACARRVRWQQLPPPPPPTSPRVTPLPGTPQQMRRFALELSDSAGASSAALANAGR